MIREPPWLDPSACAGPNRSSPSTRRPRPARCAAAALPMPPSPTTMTSACMRLSQHEGSAFGPGVGDRVLARDRQVEDDVLAPLRVPPALVGGAEAGHHVVVALEG